MSNLTLAIFFVVGILLMCGIMIFANAWIEVTRDEIKRNKTHK